MRELSQLLVCALRQELRFASDGQTLFARWRMPPSWLIVILRFFCVEIYINIFKKFLSKEIVVRVLCELAFRVFFNQYIFNPLNTRNLTSTVSFVDLIKQSDMCLKTRVRMIQERSTWAVRKVSNSQIHCWHLTFSSRFKD